MTPPRPLLAVVLAAGGSTRFGDGAKQLAQVGGTALVARAVGAALDAERFDEVLVVAGAVDLAEHLPAGVRVLDNPRWVDGQATSLAVALEAGRSLGASAIVVGLADQPGITAADWRTVADAPVDHPIVVATYAGKRANPVRLAAEVWDELPTTGDEGARVLIRLRPELVGEVACAGDPHDVDTEEDLERWN